MKFDAYDEPKQPTVLLPQHEEMLRASAITPEVIAARGYRSVTKKVDLSGCGFGGGQIRVPALLIPIHGVTGNIVLYQSRPDQPRIRDGKPVKYEFPAKCSMCLDVPPAVLPNLGNPDVPLFITEGVKKADSAVSRGLCCIALLGVWNWRGNNEFGGKTVLADWEYVALKGRKVFIVFDSDVMTNPKVYSALARLKTFLESRGAQ